MTGGISSSHTHHKRVPIQERAFITGDLIGINGYQANRTLLKQRFLEGGYQLQETPHFLLCTRTAVPSTILVHWLAPEEIDADIGKKFIQELKPLGLISMHNNLGKYLLWSSSRYFPTILNKHYTFTQPIHCSAIAAC